MKARALTAAVVTGILLSVFLMGCPPRPKPPVQTQTPIKIGAILPLSGDNAIYGQWVREGLELYREEINASGGINGSQLEIIYEDDQAEPSKATLAMQKLVEIDKVPLVYGSWASSSTLAIAPIAESSHTIVVSQAISPKIRDAGDYVFRSIPDASQSLARLVPYAFERGSHKVGILYVNNDYGLDQANVFADLLTNLGGEVVSQEGYSLDQTIFRTSLTKLMNLQLDAVFLPGYSEVGMILKQAKEIGFITQIYSSDPFENPDILEIAGDAANGVIYPFFYNPAAEAPGLSTFRQNYNQKYGRDPEGTAALAYNALTVIVEAFETAGNDSQALKTALYNIHEYDGILGSVTIDDHGDMILPIYLKTVVNDQFTYLD